MGMFRSLRRLIALTALVGWVMLQAAVTVHACPMDSGPMTPSGTSADSADVTDAAPPCGEHCATQHTVGPSLLPAALPMLASQPPLWVAPPPVVAATYQAAQQHVERRNARGDPVPLLVTLQVFRE